MIFLKQMKSQVSPKVLMLSAAGIVIVAASYLYYTKHHPKKTIQIQCDDCDDCNSDSEEKNDKN